MKKIFVPIIITFILYCHDMHGQAFDTASVIAISKLKFFLDENIVLDSFEMDYLKTDKCIGFSFLQTKGIKGIAFFELNFAGSKDTSLFKKLHLFYGKGLFAFDQQNHLIFFLNGPNLNEFNRFMFIIRLRIFNYSYTIKRKYDFMYQTFIEGANMNELFKQLKTGKFKREKVFMTKYDKFGSARW